MTKENLVCSEVAGKVRVRGYKFFNIDWTPIGEKEVGRRYCCPGVFETSGELDIDHNSIEFSECLISAIKWYGFDVKYRVAEVVAFGDIIKSDGFCYTNKLKIVRELSTDEVLYEIDDHEKSNKGTCNVGFDNLGSYNIGASNRGTGNKGSFNKGVANIGSFNSGSYNIGDSNYSSRNIGHKNNGNFNIGNSNYSSRNIGHKNKGARNIGDSNYHSGNIGDENKGLRNSGDCNRGDYNSGSLNIGDYNVGDWNLGDNNVGCFNTTPCKVRFFDQEVSISIKEWRESKPYKLLKRIKGSVWVPEEDMSEREKKEHPSHNVVGGYLKIIDLKEAANNWWNDLSQEERDVIRSIPNFDAEKFYTITGINVVIGDFVEDLSGLSWWVESEAYKLFRKVPRHIWVSKEEMSEKEKEENPSYEIVGGYLKPLNFRKAYKYWWNFLSPDEKDIISDIPGIDHEKFQMMTGISLGLWGKEYRNKMTSKRKIADIADI